MDLKKLADSLLPALGQAGVSALTDKVADLQAEAKEPWKKAALGMAGNAVAKYGPDGLKFAQGWMDELIKGEKVPDISWMDLDVASDVLANLQNAEADKKSAAKDYLAKVGEVAGEIGGAVIKGLLKSI